MNKKFYLCNDLGRMLNTNVSIFKFENLEEINYISFYVNPRFSLKNIQIEEIKKILEKEENKTALYSLEDKFQFNYVGVSDEKKEYFLIIGPFFLKDPYYEDIFSLVEMRKNDLELYNFYNTLKEIKMVPLDIISRIIYNLLNSIYEKITFEANVNNSILSENLDSESETYNKFQWNLTENRYDIENLMLKNIKLGNLDKALYYRKELNTLFNFHSRIPKNHFKASKNMLFILSGIIRKSIEECNIPYVFIHDISSKIFHKIENATRIGDVIKLGEEIVREYTELCKNNNLSFKNHSKIVNKALIYIEINIKKDISVYEISNFLEITQEHLSRVFKKEMGENIKTYINKKKIALAKEYLLKGKYKIKEISEMLGYSNSEVFSKIFKKIEKKSPSNFLLIKN
ncbi:MAG: helix-turn-helix transcriptional regulator [Cetobacterium sp.]|uniref:helix-turn-helix transcriptional regulator n=1 Tax=Cetobacterium sp. TaxID=2071632 RepID=UPI003F2A16D6